MSKTLRESFDKTVSRLARRFKSEISGIALDIDDNEEHIRELPDRLKGQVAVFEDLMAYKFDHLERKIARLDERLSAVKRTDEPS